MNFLNLTPHLIRLNDGTEIPPSGNVARVSTSYTDFDDNGVAEVKFGEIEGLPESTPDTMYIVSGLVASAIRRSDVVSPATGHPDTVRKDGRVYSVPGFIRG